MRASGAFRWSRATYFETTSTPRNAGTCATVEMLPGSGGFSIFSTEYLTSPASTSLPLWNLTPLRRLKRTDFWSAAIFHDSASAGCRFRSLSHSTSESYAACLPQWLEVRMAPNGATCTGSCSSAQMICPP